MLPFEFAWFMVCVCDAIPVVHEGEKLRKSYFARSLVLQPNIIILPSFALHRHFLCCCYAAAGTMLFPILINFLVEAKSTIYDI